MAASRRGSVIDYDGLEQDGMPARGGLRVHFTPLKYWKKVVEWTNQDTPGLALTARHLWLWWDLRCIMTCYPGHSVRG